MNIAYTTVDTEKLIDVTEKLARVNNEQGVAITVMSLMLIVMVIAFFILLFTVIKSPKKEKDDLVSFERTAISHWNIIEGGITEVKTKLELCDETTSDLIVEYKKNMAILKDGQNAVGRSLVETSAQINSVQSGINNIFTYFIDYLKKGESK